MAHILVIDDESIRSMLALILQKEGHRISVAENGKIGMNLFKAEGADLIITDLVMPEQEGVETIMQLRQQFPELPVIAMSGGGSRADTYLAICKRLGVRSTLAKPFTIEELLKTVTTVLGNMENNPTTH
jgi:DNA-binding response OmpR family regulator